MCAACSTPWIASCPARHQSSGCCSAHSGLSMRISSCAAVKECRTRPLASTSKAREPPVPTSSPSQYIQDLRGNSGHEGSRSGQCMLQRQIRRAEQSRICAEQGAFDARTRASEREGALIHFVKHTRREHIPFGQRPSAEHIQGKVKDIDEAGNRDAECTAHGFKNQFGALVSGERKLIYRSGSSVPAEVHHAPHGRDSSCGSMFFEATAIAAPARISIREN